MSKSDRGRVKWCELTVKTLLLCFPVNILQPDRRLCSPRNITEQINPIKSVWKKKYKTSDLKNFREHFSNNVLLYYYFIALVLKYILLKLLNSFDQSIVVTHENNEQPDHVHFLDIDFRSSPTMAYSTYRKPLCSYSYTPF